VSGISLAAARPAAGACPDDFAGPGLAAPWAFVDADGADGGGYAVAGGKLELTGRGRDAYNTVNEFVGISRRDIAGDFDVSVKLESQGKTHGWAQAGLLAASDLSDLAKGGYVILDATPANGYNFFYDAAQPAGTLDKYAKSASPSGYPVWLRLAKSGNAFSAWYRKAAGDPWTLLAKDIVPVGASGPSQIALVSLSHNQAVDGKAVFDDFACLHAPTAIRIAGPARRVTAAERGGILPGVRTLTGRRWPGSVVFLHP
jgi:hypothetical protein